MKISVSVTRMLPDVLCLRDCEAGRVLPNKSRSSQRGGRAWFVGEPQIVLHLSSAWLIFIPLGDQHAAHEQIPHPKEGV
jgi:hypothetical protein